MNSVTRLGVLSLGRPNNARWQIDVRCLDLTEITVEDVSMFICDELDTLSEGPLLYLNFIQLRKSRFSSIKSRRIRWTNSGEWKL